MSEYKGPIRRVTAIQARKIIAESKKPVLIQLFSNFCSACHEASPHIQKAANQNDDVEVIAVDGDFNQQFTDDLGVEGFPTVIGFRKGEKVGTMEGTGDVNDFSKFFVKCSQPKVVRKPRKPAPKKPPKPRPKPKKVRIKPKAKKMKKTDG